MSATTAPTQVDFHFDLMCPYAYQTSKWIRSVRDELDISIDWKFFSLEEINRIDGKKHPWEREWSYGWSMMRIGARLRREGMEHLDHYYAFAGEALHERGLKAHRPDVAREIVEEMGFDPGLVDEALADPTTHDEIHSEHDRVVASGGYGVPTLFFGDDALFGPVLIDPPTGDAAVKLWHAVTAWVEFPHLFELQRPKTKTHEKAIADTFKPYLDARDWISINRGMEVAFSADGIEVVGPAADRATTGAPKR